MYVCIYIYIYAYRVNLTPPCTPTHIHQPLPHFSLSEHWLLSSLLFLLVVLSSRWHVPHLLTQPPPTYPPHSFSLSHTHPSALCGQSTGLSHLCYLCASLAKPFRVGHAFIPSVSLYPTRHTHTHTPPQPPPPPPFSKHGPRSPLVFMRISP